jgi:class 3 adenylate cyclase/tetratricopeptide (TPR) repeat protein
VQISNWLRSIGLGEYASAFEKNAIDTELLPSLTPPDLTELGVIALGHRKKLAQAIARLAEQAAAAPARPVRPKASRRRFAAVAFVDLTGYTNLSEALDIEDLLQLEQRFMNVMEGLVGDFGGTVTARHGDSVIGVFGYPIAHDNDALRAAAAALEMHRAMPALTEELRADLGIAQRLQVHIGISQGEVIRSDGEGDNGFGDSVTGISLSLAKRLSDIAGPGETLITRSIERLLLGQADCRPVGDVSLQGFAEPVPVLKLVTLDVEEPGLTRTPFVDRKTEIALVLERLERCRREKHAHVITVRGEAGIGKSRLINEVSQLARTRGFAVVRATVLDFGGTRRRPIVETLAWRMFGLGGEADASARKRVRDRLAESIGGSADTRLFLDKLLGLRLRADDTSTLEAMDSRAFREGHLAFLTRLIAMEAAKQPVLFIIEDMHHANAEQLSEIAGLFGAVRDVAVTLIATWRSAESAEEENWQERILGLRATVLELDRLGDEDAMQLAANIAEAKPAQAEAAVRQANGNPLFLEQMMLHAGEAAPDGLTGNDVPDLVKTLAQARMDRLPSADHDALEVAAVLGERFDIEALREIASQPDCTCSGLVQERFVRQERHEFAFLHNLVREGVYRCLLRSRRRALHLKAAAWFSGRDPLLQAEHLEKAGDAGAAGAYYRAAEQCAFGYDYDQALTLADRGLRVPARGKVAFQLRYLKGELLAILGRREASNKAYAEALESLRNRRSRCAVLVNMARNSTYLDKPRQAKPALDEAEQIAVKLGDSKLLSAIYCVRGAIEHARGNAAPCIRYNEVAYETAVKAESAESISQALYGLGHAYYAAGLTRTAEEKFKECIAYSTRMGLERTAIQINHMTAWYAILSLHFEAALEIGRQTCADGARIRDPRTIMNGGRMQCYVLLEQGKWQEAQACLDENLSLSQELHALRYEPVIRAFAAKVMAERGAAEDAEKEVRRAYELSKQLDERWVGPTVLGCYAAVMRSRRSQDWALRKGAAILRKGCGSHNHFLFCRDAINVCLTRGDWPGARRHADALEAYAAEEPTDWSNFHIAKARAVAALGEGQDDERLRRDLDALRLRAISAGMVPEANLLDSLVGVRLSR